MIEVDRLMVEDFRISLTRMMENAGRAVANLTTQLLGGDVRGGDVLVLAGTGGNGGGGLVAARHLHNAGAVVQVRTSAPPERFAEISREQLDIVGRLGIPVAIGADGSCPESYVIDALLGYSLDGAPRGVAAELIRWAGGVADLSLDAPSGLELSTGTLHDLHIDAAATVTLAAPKAGLVCDATGRLYLADISVPPRVFAQIGAPYDSPFGSGPLVRLEKGEG